MKILLIEKQKKIIDSVLKSLASKQYEIDVVSDVIIGQEYAELGFYDLIILNIRFDTVSGFELTRKLRANRCLTPILMLTDRLEIEDRINGLDSGVDYYLVTPFDSRELLASVNALWRRQSIQVNALTFGDTSLDLFSAVLSCADKQVRLTAKEFDIMRLLLLTPSHNISKEKIISYVWGYDSYAIDNNVEVYIGFLRKKLATIDSNVSIVAVRKLGYHLECN